MHVFLRNCHKIEDLAKKIYQQLAGCTSYAPEMRAVFQKLSDDERSHALHLDLLLQATSKEMAASPMLSEGKLDEAVALAEQLFAVATAGGLDEERALTMAVRMEQQFVKVHAHNALFFDNQRLAELFEELGRADQAHLDALRDCLQRWKAERKPIL
jgi:rubrerythrin